MSINASADAGFATAIAADAMTAKPIAADSERAKTLWWTRLMLLPPEFD